MAVRLQKIDEVNRGDHFYLEEQHKCFFLREYTAHRSYEYGETNSLISNLKKGMDRRGLPEWRYKVNAIRQIAEELNGVLTDQRLENTAFIPMPPSKVRADPAYDPRLVQILNLIHRQRGRGLLVADCVSEMANRAAAHTTDEKRLPPDEKRKTLQLEVGALPQNVGRLIVFDDMVTTGSSFVAMHDLLKNARPEARVVGLFVARRVQPPAAEDFCDIDWSEFL